MQYVYLKNKDNREIYQEVQLETPNWGRWKIAKLKLEIMLTTDIKNLNSL